MEFDANTVVLALIPILSPLLTAGIKWLQPHIPVWLLPSLCTALGTLSTYIVAWSAGEQTNAAAAIGLGLAGVRVREILDQFKKIASQNPTQ